MRIGRPAVIAFVAVAAIVFGPGSAFAVCPRPKPKVCSEFFKSDVVFQGVVESELEERTREGLIGGWSYSVRVTRPYRGTTRGKATVHTENASARFRLTVGRDYLLFGSELTSCGNSGPASARAESIRTIEALSTTPSRVEGLVTSNNVGLPALRFRVQADSGATYQAVSDSRGVFGVVVPAGQYRVEPEAPNIVPFDLSYDDPRGFLLQRGQCGQVSFVTTQ